MRKGGLLVALRDLADRLVILAPVRISEVLDVSGEHWRYLDDSGMITHDLTPSEVARAYVVRQRHHGLSVNDCFCLISAKSRHGILLTGDARLRRVATEHEVKVHGVLWVVEELAAAGACPTSLLKADLRAWQGDPTVFLPPTEVSKQLRSLETSKLLPVA